MISDIRAVLAWLSPRERGRWALLVPVVSLAALIEAVGALAVFGLLRLVVDPELVRSAPMASLVSLVWLASPSDDPRAAVAVLTALVAVFYVARAVFLGWVEWFKQGIVYQSAASAAERLFARYLAADYLFHARRRSASLIEPMTRSADIACELVLASAVNVLAEGVTIAALAAVLVAATPPVTLLAVAAVLAVVLVPIVGLRRAWARIGDAERDLTQQHLHVLQQSLGAIKDVTITGRQAFFEERYRQVRRSLSRTKRRRSWAAAGARLGVEAVLILAMLLVVFLVLRQQAPGSDTVALLALFAYTGFRVVPSANRIMLNVGYLREGHAWVRGMDEDMRHLALPAPVHFVPGPGLAFTTSLACDDVSVTYEPGSAPALAGVTLAIRPGESIGIVGPTGAGKSTLVDVLLGLLTPSSGRVLVDGVALAGHERAWRRQIGYVPQDVYLLDDSLRRNIAFGVADGAIDDERLARAVTLARLDAVVAAMPQKLETVVGERGVRLSGGQRQRVAIARALYHEPDVLVFDEATAALDSQTERELTAAIGELRGTRTLIAIAHRLSTVQACDRLIYLRDGRVAGIGTYQELLADPSFRALT